MHIRIEQIPGDSRFDLWPQNRVHIVPDLGADGEDYEVLANAVAAAAPAAGASIEVGLRLGYGTKTILDALRDSNQHRTHIAIDPYGNIEYDATETRRSRLDYTNHMMHDCLTNLHLYALLNGMHFLFFPLEDTEFFSRFADGVPTYDEVKRFEHLYAFVSLDGPHTTEAVLTEFRWFHSRTTDGAMIVFDDVLTYDHDAVDHTVTALGWRMFETAARKISYRKESGAKHQGNFADQVRIGRAVVQ